MRQRKRKVEQQEKEKEKKNAKSVIIMFFFFGRNGAHNELISVIALCRNGLGTIQISKGFRPDGMWQKKLGVRNVNVSTPKKKLPTNFEEQTGGTCIQNVLSRRWYFGGLTISVEIDLRKRVEAERKDSEKTYLWT